MKYFISGRISGQVDYNRSAFYDAEKKLTRQGHAVMNPIKLHPDDPQSFDPAEYLHVCFAMIDICDMVYFLDGWEKSAGSREEFQYAIEKHKLFEFQTEVTGE